MDIRERAELLEGFRRERAEKAPVQLPDGGRFMLHLIPSKWLEDPNATYDVAKIELGSRAFPLFAKKPLVDVIDGFSFDGRLFYFGVDLTTAWSYVQFLFNGIVEAVEAHYFTREDKAIPIFDFENELILKTQDYLEIQRRIGVPEPIIFMLSIHGASGYGIEGKEFKTGRCYSRLGLSKRMRPSKKMRWIF